jgi:hypothetical protein
MMILNYLISNFQRYDNHLDFLSVFYSLNYLVNIVLFFIDYLNHLIIIILNHLII